MKTVNVLARNKLIADGIWLADMYANGIKKKTFKNFTINFVSF